jgi:DNA (cytosine-5)-methyltransferase 1
MTPEAMDSAGTILASPAGTPRPTERSSSHPIATGLKLVGLFSGIGGIEEGFRRTGIAPTLLCDIDPASVRVLKTRFPGVDVNQDVRTLKSLPKCDVVVAGFPCQDLSQAGRTAGINGSQSSLVTSVFRLLESSRPRPRWVVFENVPFMLHLDKGHAISLVTAKLEDLGYRWAYRVVDSRAFGLPQRRRRLILVASRDGDPGRVLLAQDSVEYKPRIDAKSRPACGFYWTEGNTGVGWAVDAVPPLKGSSGLGISSPPAIWMPSGTFATPEIRDAERLQGFRSDWTKPALHDDGTGRGVRWKLVGNAVSVPLAAWVARGIIDATTREWVDGNKVPIDGRWPNAGWGQRGAKQASAVSAWPIESPHPHLASFLRYATVPLSLRAASGFLARANASSLRFADGFIDSLTDYVGRLNRPESGQ